jgi:branched-chain amino acid transport system permease protein
LLGAVVLFLPHGVLPTIQSRRRRFAARRAADSAPGAEKTQRARAVDAQAGPTSHPATSGESRARHSRNMGGSGDATHILDAHGLVKSFGGLRAVDHADLQVAGGSITGLIGPNGSGKTTMFNLLDGTVPTRTGEITLAGRRLDRTGRPGRAHAGLARTYQLPRLFPSLTVIENVVLPEGGFHFRRLWTKRVSSSERRRAMAVLDDLGLAAYADSSPAELSYGQRKLIELAQVLWLDPVLVMLDEPAAGISPALSERLADMVRTLHARGVGVLLVEHDLAFLASLCDEVYVMAAGKIIAHGSVADVSAARAVIDAYLGDTVALAPVEVQA